MEDMDYGMTHQVTELLKASSATFAHGALSDTDKLHAY